MHMPSPKLQPPSASLQRQTPTPITRVPGALQQLLSAGLMAEAVEAWVEAVGGSPSLPVASGTEMWGAFEVPTTQVEAPASGLERKSFVFTQRGKFLRILVFPLKQTSEKLFSRGSGPAVLHLREGVGKKSRAGWTTA